MNFKPILILHGEPNSIFLEIFFKSLKYKKFKNPLILICSQKILKFQMKKLNFKMGIKILDPSLLNEIDLKGISKVFVACGTGTTIAGMSKFMDSTNDGTPLYGIQVLKGNGYIAKDLQDVYGIHNVTIYDEFHCGGYAKTSPELMDFIKEFTSETGILLDPVYTGKMMLAIKKLCISGDIKKGDKVIAIHTGGLTGWFGKVDEL